MSQEEKLDQVLAVLAKHHTEYEQVYDFYFNDEIKSQLQILLGQVVKDGFATMKEIPHPEINESYNIKIVLYRITNEGITFHTTSSYQQRAIRERKKKYWSAVEKISIATNAVLLLLIAIGGLYVSNKANQDKEENKELRHTIDSLENIIREFDTDTTQYSGTSMQIAIAGD